MPGQEVLVSSPNATVDAYVAGHYRFDAAELEEHGHRAGPAKAVAVELACRLTGLSGRAAGMHYGGISASAVSNIRRKVREGPAGVLPVVDQVLATIQKTTSATAQSVK